MKITELIPDSKNFNLHTEKGRKLLEKSLKKLGLGRSILLDKDNNIIAGNGVVEAAKKLGVDNVRIIETDGKEVIAVRRSDIELDSLLGREMALADNQAAVAGIDLDKSLIFEVGEEYGKNLLNDWEVFDSKGQLVKNFEETDKGVFNDKGLPYPVTIIITEEDYEYWTQIKERLKETNDRDAFFKIIERKKK